MKQLVTGGTVVNVAMTAANTEYSYTLPVHTRKFMIQLRDATIVGKLAFAEGTSGTTYVTIRANGNFFENDLYTVDHSPITLYFQSATASQVAEIVYWD